MGRSFENRKHAIFKTAAIKSKLYSRFGKLLYVAAKNGVPNPENNPTLRHLVERAKREQVPAHVIDRAIEKAAGAGGEDFVTVRYEGFGPGGTSVIVDCLTDNNNRTITDVRNCFNRTGSRMGPTGSVSHMFDHVALFQFVGDDGDRVLEVMLNADVDVDDVEVEEGQISLYAKASEFFKAKTALQDGFPGLELETAEVTWLAQSSKQISGEDAQTFKKFLDLLNECDDVQEVYHNAVLAE